MLLLLATGQPAAGATAIVAYDMVGSADQNLISYVNNAPAFSSPADGFGKFQRGVSQSIPFSLLDDSLSIFTADSLGIIKEGNTDEFFGVTDTENPDNSGEVSAEWRFDISGASDLSLALNVGAMGDFESGDSGDRFEWTYQIDGGPVNTAFASTVDESGSHTYTLEGGASFTLNDPMQLQGVTLTNDLQTFVAPLEGSGNELVLTLTAATNGGSEAFVFQDLVISQQIDAPVINEFVFNHTGSDTNEFVEVFGAADTDYSALTLLEIEGDSGSTPGVIDGVFPLGATDANGFWTTGFLSNELENGSVTLLLVDGFSGSAGDDLDADDDGALDAAPWNAVLDAVAVYDGDSGDGLYAGVVLEPYFDGVSFTPGGASRIPNGVDTDTASDWMRNDYGGAGLPGFGGDPALGEALNTPGAPNEAFEPNPFGACGDAATFVHAIQGAGFASPEVGNIHVVEGVVVGDFQDTATGLRGFFLQEEDADVDGDSATSEGIFVFDNGFGVDVNVGDIVRVQGSVSEFFGLTELGGVTDVAICEGLSGGASAASMTLPVSSLDDWETVEGMLVNVPQTLYVTENYNQGRYGEVSLSVDNRLFNPTNVVEPGLSALALQDLNDRSRIQLDDGSTVENPEPLPPYLGANGTLRSGDTVDGVTGALGYAFGAYEIHPVEEVNFTRVNERTAEPADVGGSIRVASFNVLNYFTTIDDSGPICGPDADQGCRGADTVEEFERQRAKILAGLLALDADIVGLNELENNAQASLQDLVDGLNAETSPGTYAYVDTGTIGDDAIKVGLIYRPATVTPVGDYAILDNSVDPDFFDSKNRPALAQTFQENGTDDRVTVVVNHLKSKGSACDDIVVEGVEDRDAGDGQGNCNLTRTSAAETMVEWLATDPTGSGSSDFLITGDLNAYAMEDPIDAIESAGYVNLVRLYEGHYAYSYVFFGQAGYLDHALATPSLASRVTGATIWHANADEPSALNYNNYNQDALYSPDPYRASDHDPVVVGLCETTPPVVRVSASPDVLWPPNHKLVDVMASVDVIDADSDPTINLMGVTSNEPDNGLGDGDRPNDIVIVDDFNFRLRAERSGTDRGRLYIIVYEAVDSCGNRGIGRAIVAVPHDARSSFRGAPVVPVR